MNRQATKWTKVSATHITNRGIISRPYNKFLQINEKKTTGKKNGEKTYTCYRRGNPVPNKHMKKCSISIISEMQTQSTALLNYLPTVVAIVKY